MVRSDPNWLLSTPCKVHFQGFVSDTFRLQQNGWELSAEQSFLNGSVTLAFRSRQTGLYMVSRPVSWRVTDHLGRMSLDNSRAPEFQIDYCSSGINVVIAEDFNNYSPIDATPQWMSRELSTKHVPIENYKLFATQLVRTEEIIVHPSSVAECLEHIRKLQAPELAAIRKRNREQEPIKQHLFHAQILSLAA